MQDVKCPLISWIVIAGNNPYTQGCMPAGSRINWGSSSRWKDTLKQELGREAWDGRSDREPACEWSMSLVGDPWIWEIRLAIGMNWTDLGVREKAQSKCFFSTYNQSMTSDFEWRAKEAFIRRFTSAMNGKNLTSICEQVTEECDTLGKGRQDYSHCEWIMIVEKVDHLLSLIDF